ncbi:PepSY domain-containing protein [Paracoccus sp. pheM1]|uniref:PepSY-associated TM helix domain-containing protein n=1 Tax=Paracoccus sp. pheM1 TaxID=2831675 RepID=UPI001F0B1151|nr:PepSY domain-containing protein [Paracoccus sp. pheM1]
MAFYAGLLVLPFMITLSINGAMYVFRNEIDNWYHADLKRVQVQDSQRLAPTAQVASTLDAVPGTAVKYTDPADPGASTKITVSTERGKMAVYVNPYNGLVLGAMPDRSTIMWTIRTLHSFKYFGTWTRYVIEIAAGWSILLVGTGTWRWWPRGQKGGIVSVRGKPQRRVFWRDLHAVTGLLVGLFIVFLAVTGMPWSGVWGSKVNEWANGNNFGYPDGVRVNVPMSQQKLDQIAKTSWSLEQAQIPESPVPGGTPITLDDAIASFDRLGLHRGYAVNLPQKPEDMFSGSVYPDDLTQQRVVHLDQYSGQPLLDMGYADYGPLGKWLEWGINTHMGQSFGVLNHAAITAIEGRSTAATRMAGLLVDEWTPERIRDLEASLYIGFNAGGDKPAQSAAADGIGRSIPGPEVHEPRPAACPASPVTGPAPTQPDLPDAAPATQPWSITE